MPKSEMSAKFKALIREFESAEKEDNAEAFKLNAKSLALAITSYEELLYVQDKLNIDPFFYLLITDDALYKLIPSLQEVLSDFGFSTLGALAKFGKLKHFIKNIDDLILLSRQQAVVVTDMICDQDIRAVISNSEALFELSKPYDDDPYFHFPHNFFAYILQQEPRLIEDLSAQDVVRQWEIIQSIVKADPGSLSEILKNPTLRTTIEKHATPDWLKENLYTIRETDIEKEQDIDDQEKSLIVVTNCTFGSGDYRAAIKLLKALESTDRPITWLIQGTPPETLKADLAALPHVNCRLANRNHIGGYSPEFTQLIKEAKACIVFPNTNDLKYLMRAIYMVNPVLKNMDIPEYGYSIMKAQESSAVALTTGIRAENLGIFIDEKTESDSSIENIDDKVREILFKDATQGMYANECELFFGYSDLSKSNSGAAELFIHTVLAAQSESTKNIDIALPYYQRMLELISDEYLKEMGISEIEWINTHGESEIRETGLQGGKKLRILNVFPMSKPSFDAMLHLSNPFNLCTGDQSFGEVLTGAEGRMPLYQIQPWKMEYYQDYIELCKELHLGKLADYFELAKNTSDNVRDVAKKIAVQMKDPELTEQLKSLRNYLVEHKNLYTTVGDAVENFLNWVDESNKRILNEPIETKSTDVARRLYSPTVPMVEDLEMQREIFEFHDRITQRLFSHLQPIESTTQEEFQPDKQATLRQDLLIELHRSSHHKVDLGVDTASEIRSSEKPVVNILGDTLREVAGFAMSNALSQLREMSGEELVETLNQCLQEKFESKQEGADKMSYSPGRLYIAEAVEKCGWAETIQSGAQPGAKLKVAVQNALVEKHNLDQQQAPDFNPGL